MGKFSHLNKRGEAVMVDVSEKRPTVREAVAEGVVTMTATTFRAVLDGGIDKGDVLGVARIAGIMAAKKTPALIPLCHPLPISAVTVDFETDGKKATIRAICTVRVDGRTGVEMEALTGAAVACLTIYDMCKALDKGIEIAAIRLLKKSGGKSGTYIRGARHGRTKA